MAWVLVLLLSHPSPGDSGAGPLTDHVVGPCLRARHQVITLDQQDLVQLPGEQGDAVHGAVLLNQWQIGPGSLAMGSGPFPGSQGWPAARCELQGILLHPVVTMSPIVKAVQSLLVGMDQVMDGHLDEIVRRVLLSGGEVMAVRQEDLPDASPVAAILRSIL